MADQAISAKEAKDRAFTDPLQWYDAKLKLARVLGIDTFCKDLLEFGHNQGWNSGDPNWVLNAQPPLTDIWERLVPFAAGQGFTLLPYYEYKGAIGYKEAPTPSLGWQRRAHKLYHGIARTADEKRTDQYTGIWWVEDHNADLTDPDTLTDFRRVLDRTVLQFKDKTAFAGIWMRTRDNHLPMSFSDKTIARFNAEYPNNASTSPVSRADLIKSYEGDHTLYQRYVSWWFEKRTVFLSAIQNTLADNLKGEPQVLFTPWTTEQVPTLVRGDSAFTGVGLVTDDSTWWDSYAKTLNDNWYRWKWVPTSYETIMSQGWWRRSLSLQPPINDSGNWGHQEGFHSAPVADPEHYTNRVGIMMTYPVGRMFTVANNFAINDFRTKSGLTVIHHFTLNENDEGWEKRDENSKRSQPFQNVAGYVVADVDRAGTLVMLQEARAVALADPINIGFLTSANFSTGFPNEVRRFIQAFVSVPALPSTVVEKGTSHPDVILRMIPTANHGVYYLLVNSSWNHVKNVEVRFSATQTVTCLPSRRTLGMGSQKFDLRPAELMAFHCN